MIGGKLFVAKRHADAVDKAIAQFGADSPEIKAFEDDPLSAIGMLAEKAGKTQFGVPYKKGFTANGISGDGGAELGRRIESARTPEPEPEPGITQAQVDQVASAFPPAEVQAKVTRANNFTASQPARSLDETYEVIGFYQDDLDAVGQQAARENNAVWRNPGLKDKASAADKMKRKGYESTAELTDLVRGGFEVKTPRDADEIVESLRQMYGDILDEGWRMTAVNYFDRKVLIRFDDGTIGEVQFWHPDMLRVKSAEGHRLYEEAPELEAKNPNDPRIEELFAAQRRLYASALPETEPAWSPVVSGLLGKSSTPGNAVRNAASLMGSPDSITSTREAGFQPEFDLGTNSADAPSTTAGLPSQLKNIIDGAPAVRQPEAALNFAEPMPDPVPDGLDAATTRIGKPETMKELAASHGVSEDGSYIEQADVDQLRTEGRLTPEDEAELAAADQMVADADAYADTLAVAARCVIS